ncbi:MAG: radical SAM protein [Ruminococcus sp.]|nr:radical SAM protein [Ruminococcus sp.]
MKQLKQPNEKVIAFIKTNSPESEGLRPASWTVSFSEGGVNLMKNMFSGEVVQLTDEEYSAPERIAELVKRRFIVPADYDEAEKYTETMQLIKLMQPEKPGLKTYTILPTTACNARCTYCYEEGYAVKTMTPEIVEHLIDFICKTRQEDKITLSWFGGEPLACAGIISHVCKELSERGVPFKSRIITNASLMTKELAHKAKEVWKLERVQVSLDGDRNDYMERKQYIDTTRHNYDVVMKAIQYLAEEGINVSLRVNFDKDNLPGMQGFINEMEERFGSYDNVDMYLYMLFQQQHKPDCVDVYRQMYSLYQANTDSKLLRGIKAANKLKLNHCMADSLDKSIVIAPDGKFHRCEHLPGNDHSWGNVFDGITDKALLEQMNRPALIDEKCRDCAFLSVCTPFYKTNCPDHFEYCAEYQQFKTEYELRKLSEKKVRDA